MLQQPTPADKPASIDAAALAAPQTDARCVVSTSIPLHLAALAEDFNRLDAVSGRDGNADALRFAVRAVGALLNLEADRAAELDAIRHEIALLHGEVQRLRHLDVSNLAAHARTLDTSIHVLETRVDSLSFAQAV